MSASSRWTAGALGLVLAAGAATLALIPAGSADAAQKPTPSYTAGHDHATFGITGVEDSNCVISTGGTTVYIKPGDEIDFDSSIISASIGGINLLGGKVTGLNVNAVIDAKKNARKTFTVPAGKTVKIKKLSSGNHSLAWTATSVSVAIPATLLTPAKTITIPLSNATLQSGAKLSWSGVIHVTKSAPQCTVTVATPKTKISVGPVKATVPPVKATVPGVTLPTKLPSVPNLLPTKGHSAPAKGGKKAAPGKTSGKTKTYRYTPPALTIPDEVVPHGSGDGVYSGGGGYTVGSSNGSGLTDGTPSTTTSGSASGPSGSVKTSAPQLTQDSTGKHKTIDLASSTDSHSAQLPVLLAILAVIALAMVAGTYARLYLLGRKK